VPCRATARARLAAAIAGETLSAEEMGMSIPKHHGPAKYFMWLSAHVWKITSGAIFQNFITMVILLAAVLVGMSANGNDAQYLDYLNDAVLYVFTAEAALKIIAEGLKPWRYFYDLWNIFDFGVVLGCYIPGAPNSVLQLLRLLRVVKIIRKVLIRTLAAIIRTLTAIIRTLTASICGQDHAEGAEAAPHRLCLHECGCVARRQIRAQLPCRCAARRSR
jgi:hypothetical protein